MPIRPNPHDTPKRETTWRRGKIRTRIGQAADGYAYIVDFPQQGTELAFSHALYDVEDTVHARWRNEAATWWIDGGRVFTAYPYVYAYRKSNGTYLRIRDMLPVADQITSPWTNEPVSIGPYPLNQNDNGTHVILPRAVRWNAAGTQVALIWDVFVGGSGSPNGEVWISRWSVPGDGEWGDLIETVDITALLGFPADAPLDGGPSQHLAYSHDGKYIATWLDPYTSYNTGHPHCVVILGGADTANLYLADHFDYHTVGTTPFGALSFSHDDSLLVVSDLSPFSDTRFAVLLNWDSGSETLSFAQDVNVTGTGSEGSRAYASDWAPDSSVLFLGLNGGTTVGGVWMGSVVAYPVAGGALGAPVYEARADTRPILPLSPNTRFGNTPGISVAPDGIHVAISNLGAFYVSPFETGAWGTRSNLASPSGGQHLLDWFDEQYLLISSVGNARYREPANNAATNRYPVAMGAPTEDGAFFLEGTTFHHARPPTTRTRRQLPAPFPDLVPATPPLPP